MSLLVETRDPLRINYFANHPEIAPHIGGGADFTNAIRETAVFLHGAGGMFIYEWCAPCTYEVHVMLTEAGRGLWGFQAAKDSIAIMVAKGADHLWCRIKDRHVGIFARRAGFRDAGSQVLYAPERATYQILNWRA